jgi:hypothetical protein
MEIWKYGNMEIWKYGNMETLNASMFMRGEFFLHRSVN